jgi:hypothetical protein
VPKFVAEIKTVFDPWEMREYLSGRRDVFGHTANGNQAWAVGMIHSSPMAVCRGRATM